MNKAIKNMIVIPLIYLAVTILLSLILIPLSYGIAHFDSLFFFDMWNTIITGIFTPLPIITTAIVIWYANKKHGINIKEKLNVKKDIKSMAICFALAFSATVLVVYIFGFLALTPIFSVNIIGNYRNFFVSLIFTCLVIPVCEELEYRICSISIGEKYVSKTKAMVLTSVLVGFLNSGIILIFIFPNAISNSLFGAFLFTAFGLFIGYIFIATDNIYCSLSSNIGAEFALLVCASIARSDKFSEFFYIITDRGNYIPRAYLPITAIIVFILCLSWFKKLYMKDKTETNEKRAL